jgi:hypothetical protein
MLAAAVALASGCASSAPPPLPEVLVVVDTDLPVPRVASRLRIDLYAEDGRWFASAGTTAAASLSSSPP